MKTSQQLLGLVGLIVAILSGKINVPFFEIKIFCLIEIRPFRSCKFEFWMGLFIFWVNRYCIMVGKIHNSFCVAGLVLSDQGFKDVYSAIKVLTSRPRTPVFDPSIPTKVIVPSETTAILTCKVHNLGNYTVSLLGSIISLKYRALLNFAIFSSRCLGWGTKICTFFQLDV